MNINGSCFCKKIAFKGEVDPEKCFACHCKDCQIFSGAPYRGVVQCEKTNLNIKGKPKEYIKIGSCGSRRIQSFCEKCGTHLFESEMKRYWGIGHPCLFPELCRYSLNCHPSMLTVNVRFLYNAFNKRNL